MTYWRGWNVVDYRGAPPPLDIEDSGVFIGSLAVLGSDGLNAHYRGRDINDLASRFKQILWLADPFWTDTLSGATIKIGVSSDSRQAGSFYVDGLDDAINAVWTKALFGEAQKMNN